MVDKLVYCRCRDETIAFYLYVCENTIETTALDMIFRLTLSLSLSPFLSPPLSLVAMVVLEPPCSSFLSLRSSISVYVCVCVCVLQSLNNITSSLEICLSFLRHVPISFITYLSKCRFFFSSFLYLPAYY